jgi:hypothetical protein
MQSGWEADDDLAAFVRDRLELRLGNYERIPDEVRDHHETELEALAGGYSYRQVLELVQNAADAIRASAIWQPPLCRQHRRAFKQGRHHCAPQRAILQ